MYSVFTDLALNYKSRRHVLIGIAVVNYSVYYDLSND